MLGNFSSRFACFSPATVSLTNPSNLLEKHPIPNSHTPLPSIPLPSPHTTHPLILHTIPHPFQNEHVRLCRDTFDKAGADFLIASSTGTGAIFSPPARIDAATRSNSVDPGGSCGADLIRYVAKTMVSPTPPSTTSEGMTGPSWHRKTPNLRRYDWRP